jgi:photosystem II stability/assembly factor-like uncharacterized protein
MKVIDYLTTLLIYIILLFGSGKAIGQVYLDLLNKTDMSFEEILDSTESYFDNYGRDKGQGYKVFQRWKYEAERSLDDNGRIRTRRQDLDAYRQFQKKNPRAQSKSVGVHYMEMGPVSAVNTATWSSALGRFSALGLDINDPKHIIAGSPSGGIWKTIDGGNTWYPCYDHTMDIDIWSLEISHADRDLYFAGTNSEIVYSTDGGLSWDRVNGGPLGNQVNTIIMDPGNSNVLLATDRWGEGIWRSSDGGINWTKVYSAPNDSYDIEFKPGNSNIVYASGLGFIAKSTDNGQSWTEITTGPWLSGGVIMLAVTADASSRLYALQETGGGYHATFLSLNEGANWTTQSDNSSGTNNILTYNQNNGGGQAPRDMDIVVSPTDKNEVYVAGVELWRSTDQGVNFIKIADWLVNSALPFIHADVDLLYYNDNALYAATDGGLFVSTDNAVSWTDWTSGTGVRQFYRIGVSATELDRVSGGSQDNGTGTLVNGVWYDWVGADGMETFIDWSDEDVIYTNIQFGGLYKSIDGGQTTVGITQTQGGDQGSWVTPTEQDPLNPNTIYQAKAEVYKSTNGGGSWTTISALAQGFNCHELEIAPSNNQYIYASWDNKLFRTTDGGLNWNMISPGYTNRINYIDVHPTDPDRVVLASSAGIYETTNGGSNWVDISNNLPNITYFCAIYANDGSSGIYAGGRPGIYYINNATSNNWLNVTGDLPLVQVRELEIKHNFLYVATYGRGLWKTAIQTVQGMNCNDAIVIDKEGTYTAIGPSFGNGCHNCNSSAHANWYSFTPEYDGIINVYSCLGGTDTRLFVYEGSCAGLTQIANNDDNCVFDFGSLPYASEVNYVPVTAGVEIFLEWDNRWSNDSFTWTLEYCADAFTGANALSGIQNSSKKFETEGAIESTQSIGGNSTRVSYDYGTHISLMPGFEIDLGAIFEAYKEGCYGFR